ncbi:MAG TPA: molybdate ABC transporter substrate-binding protein [Pelomicrobium sp.]|nr:molybdate ABC transporter substrate-binding protein [Pelomicrobium sp.]
MGSWAGRVAAVLLLASWALPAPGQPLTVFAAASLKTALDAAAGHYHQQTNVAVVASYAGSAALAKQIEQGAPADVFVSANVKWMDYLQERKAIDPATRVDLLRNGLVLVAPKASAVDLKIGPGMPLAEALGNGRLAMGDPDHVPAGLYGKAALETLGAWRAVAPKVARADNVRAALTLVARGEAPLGIVYRTDAAAEPGVRVVGAFPADSHPPIVYPAAVTSRSHARAEAARFIAFLRGAEAAAIFERHGFTLVR